MKVVIIGGSAQSTPQLVDAPEFRSLAGELELVLVGRNARDLAAVARAMARLARPARLAPRVRDARTELAAALAGADVVLLQARYGGYAARAFDEAFPLRYGIPGDEGLGPGGLANAWRSWPEIDALLAVVGAVAPGATVVCLTAPLGILTRCALRHRSAVPFVGACELPFVTLRAACERAGLPWRAAAFDYAGVNHIGWFDAVEAGGASLVEPCDPLALKYVWMHRFPERAVEQQRRARSRAAELQAIRTATLPVFARGEPAAIRAALRLRPAPWYETAVAPLLAALAGRAVDTPLFLTTANAGYLPELDADDVIEIPHAAQGGRLERTARRGRLAGWICDELRALTQYERLAAAAVEARSPTMLATALAAHPWVRDSQIVPALVAAIRSGPDAAFAAV